MVRWAGQDGGEVLGSGYGVVWDPWAGRVREVRGEGSVCVREYVRGITLSRLLMGRMRGLTIRGLRISIGCGWLTV